LPARTGSLDLVAHVLAGLIERVHPATKRHMVYVACRVVSGTAELVDHEELAEIAWSDLHQLAERVLGGVFEPVQEYLNRTMTPLARLPCARSCARRRTPAQEANPGGTGRTPPEFSRRPARWPPSFPKPRATGSSPAGVVSIA
jgi:hypothetical protein